ncbi:hypothetical protein PHLGIDRAFT_399773 [Phlebiopsis gigantea 11061_1 CR5-6]|uniref:Protein YOP1 n=1 Tax=Phlebiopsis gigantea (strain 11061_1 CR5-6) TaxID=745531 RepID=A0A0C3PVU9_PHLG1|nr:hypothetical protein PHLGIDRAFT_399773 [Phlebiopsis gigantea 11061_1 CR5-6]
MLMALASRIVGAWFAFLIPAYSTWKALSHRPLSEPDLERWAMYWTCVGAFIAFESVAEWFISWFPFYWELRTLVLLFMSLPQTQGSTFVYQTYFDPYFKKNEADIDAGIVAAQTNTITFAQAKATAIWEAAWRIATKSGAPSAGAPATGTPSGQTPSAQQAPPNLFAMGSQLFQTYGPWAMGAIKSSVGSIQTKSTTTGSVNASNPPLPTPPATKPAPSPGLQQRSPYASRENVATPPVFPEPQHF